MIQKDKSPFIFHLSSKSVLDSSFLFLTIPAQIRFIKYFKTTFRFREIKTSLIKVDMYMCKTNQFFSLVIFCHCRV